MKNDSHICVDPIYIEECVSISLIEILQPYPDIVKREAWDELTTVGGCLVSLHNRLSEDIGMFHTLSSIPWLVLGVGCQTRTNEDKHFMGVTAKLLRKTGPMVNRLVRKLNSSLKTSFKTVNESHSDPGARIIKLLSCDDSLALQIAVCLFDSVSDGRGVFDGYVWIPDYDRKRLK